MSIKSIVLLIVAIYFITGIISGFIYLISRYHEHGFSGFDSSDMGLFFMLFLLGVIGLGVTIFQCIDEWFEEAQPVETFLNFLAKKTEKLFDKISKKGKKDAVD